VGTAAVAAGQTIRIVVVDEAVWEYGAFRVPFTLTTSLD
jgi:hypothetical protein